MSFPIPASNPQNIIKIIIGILIPLNINIPTINIEKMIGNVRTVSLVLLLSSFAPSQFPTMDATP